MNLRQVRPLSDRITVRILKREEKIGSIVIPETAQDQTGAQRCEVIAVGPGRVTDTGKLIEIQGIKAGDTALVGKYAGTPIEIDGEKIAVVRFDDVLAVVEEA